MTKLDNVRELSIYELNNVSGGDLGSGSQMSMLELQSLVSQRQNAVQLATGILKAISEGAKAVVANIGHYRAATVGGLFMPLPGRDRVQGEEIEMGLMIFSCLALVRVWFSTETSVSVVLRALALTCNRYSEARLRGPSNIQ